MPSENLNIPPTEIEAEELQACLLLAHAQFNEPVTYTEVIGRIPTAYQQAFVAMAAQDRDFDRPGHTLAYDLERNLFYGKLLSGLVCLRDAEVPFLGAILTQEGQDKHEELKKSLLSTQAAELRAKLRLQSVLELLEMFPE